jgi:hypothetical protein
MSAVSFLEHRTFLASEEVEVRVVFRKGVSREELWERIDSYYNPKVIFWYIGPYGLKARGVEYYREDLKQCVANGGECVLYDLTAWAGLSNRNCSLSAVSQSVEKINSFAIENIRALASSEFFHWLSVQTDPHLTDPVLKRDFVWTNSKDFRPNKVATQEIFNQKIVDPLLEKDTAHCYSAFQYLEGLFLVEKLVKEGASNIVFALPNDEWKYYEDKLGSFEKDLAHRLGRLGIKDRMIRIEFCTFLYGDDLQKRPYLGEGKGLRLNQRSDLIGE